MAMIRRIGSMFGSRPRPDVRRKIVSPELSAIPSQLGHGGGSVDLAGCDDGIHDFSGQKTALLLLCLSLLVRIPLLFLATPNNGVDAWARYSYSVGWLRNPGSLPAATAHGAWLPLHFWLLGGSIWIWNSEWSARILTALLGALTVLPFWAVVRRTYGEHVAFYAGFAFAIFGFHAGYSVTTSSEVPTIFFLVSGFYCWVRLCAAQTWRWALASGLLLDGASLSRFEPWLLVPVLTVLLLDSSEGWKSIWSNRRAWWNAVRFAIPASAGPVGWMWFSWWKWGDPMMLPHRTISENLSAIAELHHGLLYRSAVVPGALFVSLGPLIVLLAALGCVTVFLRGTKLAKSIVLVALILFGFNYYNSVRHEVTQAKYTLIYDWLFFPVGFAGLYWIAQHWNSQAKRRAAWSVLVFQLVWQVGIVFGGLYAPPFLADRLAAVAPTLPPKHELRELLAWLKVHHRPSDTLVLDEYNYEGVDILRFSGMDPSRVFLAKTTGYQDPDLESKVEDFMRARTPHLMICSPDGPVGRALAAGQKPYLEIPSLGLRLHRAWQGPHWTVYLIENLSSPDPSEGA